MDLIEKKGETVFFMYKILCSEYAKMQDFASNFQNCSTRNKSFDFERDQLFCQCSLV
jgi:hypothetical protein